MSLSNLIKIFLFKLYAIPKKGEASLPEKYRLGCICPPSSDYSFGMDYSINDNFSIGLSHERGAYSSVRFI